MRGVSVELEQPQESVRARRSPLSCEVFRDFRGLERLQSQWDDVVLRTCRCVYMTYDWVRLWWEYYGGAAQLRLFVFSAGDRIVAIVPIYVDTFGWGPFRFRVARLVGANIPPKVFNVPVTATYEREVFDKTIEHLFVLDKCDALSFGPVPEGDESNAALLAACERHHNLVKASAAAIGVHSVYHLPRDMDEYYGTMLRKSERKNRRKLDLRLLKKEHAARVEVVKNPAVAVDAFEHFAEQHRQQWFQEGRTGHFGAWPHAMAFHRALIEAQGQQGRLRFIRVVADEEVVASEYAFAVGDRYYAELTSRAVDPKWDRFSLGPTSTVAMLAEAIAEGMQRVESGLGHYEYKVRLGATEYAVRTLRIVASTPLSRARFALLSFARGCASVVYHKVWYRRVAPRLPPFFRRPQSRLWLRLDF